MSHGVFVLKKSHVSKKKQKNLRRRGWSVGDFGDLGGRQHPNGSYTEFTKSTSPWHHCFKTPKVTPKTKIHNLSTFEINLMFFLLHKSIPEFEVYSINWIPFSEQSFNTPRASVCWVLVANLPSGHTEMTALQSQHHEDPEFGPTRWNGIFFKWFLLNWRLFAKIFFTKKRLKWLIRVKHSTNGDTNPQSSCCYFSSGTRLW